MKKIALLAMALLALIIAACSPTPAATPTPPATPTQGPANRPLAGPGIDGLSEDEIEAILKKAGWPEDIREGGRAARIAKATGEYTPEPTATPKPPMTTDEYCRQFLFFEHLRALGTRP